MTQDQALFPEQDAYDGDPIRPDLETPTPASIVAALTPADRRRRLASLTDQAHHIIDLALDRHLAGRTLHATAVLFSGGNDSTTLAHLMRARATHAIHANTTIGVEQTRQYVRDTCAAWKLPLIERKPGQSFREYVLEPVNGVPRGFPGPGMHQMVYTRIKERALDLARHDLGIANSRTRAALFVAGRRRLESDRRTTITLHEPDGSVIWASPIANWSKLDLNTYRDTHPDVPRNPVTDHLHMSGECLCGAYAKRDELEAIGYWYPDVVTEIRALEAESRASGTPEPYCRWGHGQGKPSGSGRLCSSCVLPGQLTLED